MNWSSLDNFVLWAGHFIIGLAYYLRYYFFKPQEEIDEEISKAIAEKPEAAKTAHLVKNKLLVLVIYLIVGYFNLLLSAKIIFKKIRR